MHISMTAEVAPGSSPRPSILRSAEIIASGFLVSSTEPASARYSRRRDSANRMTIDRTHASVMSTTAIRIATPAPLRSPFPRPPRQRKPPWNSRRKMSSAKNAITPAIITAITSMRTSPLRMWVNSWPRTDSSSASLSELSRPDVTVMEYCFSFMPVAKALRLSSSITLSVGMVMPREMQRFSRML